MKYQNILFDLDGTLTDPKVGITKSVAYALSHFGIIVEDTDTLVDFIGPPLAFTFAKNYGFDDEKCSKAIEVYREYFSVTGKFENTVYPFTRDILEFAKKNGFNLFVATSKPEIFARDILVHFDLAKYFTDVVGIAMHEEKVEKDVIVNRVIDRYNLEKERTLMIGDRMFDIEGAHKNGIDCCAVLFGYGNREEFIKYGADYTVDTNEDLFNFIKGIA